LPDGDEWQKACGGRHVEFAIIVERPWIMHWYTRDHFEKLVTTAGLAMTAVTDSDGTPAPAHVTDLLHFRLQAI
jgi:hypothetical protein